MKKIEKKTKNTLRVKKILENYFLHLKVYLNENNCSIFSILNTNLFINKC